MLHDVIVAVVVAQQRMLASYYELIRRSSPSTGTCQLTSPETWAQNSVTLWVRVRVCVQIAQEVNVPTKNKQQIALKRDISSSF